MCPGIPNLHDRPAFRTTPEARVQFQDHQGLSVSAVPV